MYVTLRYFGRGFLRAEVIDLWVAKALELFLTMIIEEANKVTAARGSKKVEAYHL